ncbi:hypothetical protein FRC01_011168, partial [Tulasnella sp. 417]
MSSLSPPSSITRARSSSTAGNLTQARSRAATTASPSSAQSADHSSSSASPADRKGAASAQQPQDPESPTSKPTAKMFNVLLTMSRVITQDAFGAGPKEKSSVDLTAAISAAGAAAGGKVVTWEDEKRAAASLLAAGGAIADRAADLVQQRRGAHQQRTRLPPPSAKPRRAGHKRQPSPFSSLFISPPPLSPLPPPAVSSPRTPSFAGRFSPSSFHLPHLPSISRPSSPSSSSAASPSSPSTLLPPPRILLPIFFVCSVFFITLLPIVIGVWTLPIHSIKHLPRTVQDIKQVARELN